MADIRTRVSTAGIGFVLAIIGLVVAIVLWLIGKMAPAEAWLFALAFLAIIL